MAVKVRGSAFKFGNQVNADDAKFDDFFKWLNDSNGKVPWPYFKGQSDNDSYRRELYINSTDTTFCGVLISARTSEFRHYVSNVGGKIQIKAKSTGGNPPVEVNFFCLKRDNYKGIYSNYHGSYAFSKFLSDIWRTYTFFVNMKYQKGIELVDEKTAEAIKENYSLRNLNFTSPIYSPGSFGNLLAELKKVQEVRFTTYELEDEDDCRPVNSKINNVHKTIRFTSELVDDQMKSWISMIRGKSARRVKSSETPKYYGSILGWNNSDKEVTIDFENTLDDYLEYDYDDLGDIDVDRIAEHDIVKSMNQTISTKKLFK